MACNLVTRNAPLTLVSLTAGAEQLPVLVVFNSSSIFFFFFLDWTI